MGQKLFLSHSLNTLASQLIEHLNREPISPIKVRTVLVPHSSMKNWLLLEIAKKKGIAMGFKIMTPDDFFSSSPFLEVFCHIFTWLDTAEDLELKNYLKGKREKIFHFAKELSALFGKYAKYGPELFDQMGNSHWQRKLFEDLFMKGPLRTFAQLLGKEKKEVICFGIDEMPALFWNSILPTVFLFSPCSEFWEDICSSKERRGLIRMWKKKKVSLSSQTALNEYLREAPKHLASWGGLGRETLKTLDPFDFDVEESYPKINPSTMLNRLKANILYFEDEPISTLDSSIKIFQTGSSKLREIECLKEEILKLSIPFHEISVLAPDIELYVPFIEFVFSKEIPYKISGFDIASQSSFKQGLHRIFHLLQSRWEAEDVLTLFETASFYKKRGWDGEDLEEFRTWILRARIEWGLNQEHREKILKEDLAQEKKFADTTSWEKGLDQLLDGIIRFSSFQIQPDRLEEFLKAFLSLKSLSLEGEKSLYEWADVLEKIEKDFLTPDLNEETDVAGYHSFKYFISDLRKSENRALFPFGLILYLLDRPIPGQIHPSHLHAVRFSPIQTGALFPAKAIFMIGMDEESFPRIKIPSSIDLLKDKKIPEVQDKDRYLFLQAFLSAEEFLRISYNHLTKDEGKPVSPSLPVQELLSTLPKQVISIYRQEHAETFRHSWPALTTYSLSQAEEKVSLSELRALMRHPWKFYFQKAKEIYFKERVEETFAMQRGKWVRECFEENDFDILGKAHLPLGPLGEALKDQIVDEVDEWKRQISEWGLKPFTLVFRESCKEGFFEEEQYILPPLELDVDGVKVKILGDVKYASQYGLISVYKDKIEHLIKAWPDALVASLAFHTPKIWMLQTGKVKELSDSKKALEALIRYYFQCIHSPSPLLPDWVDSLLRKGKIELEKQMKKEPSFEDPVFNWVKARFEIPSAGSVMDEWSSFLKESFSGLISLYPTRSKK